MRTHAAITKIFGIHEMPSSLNVNTNSLLISGEPKNIRKKIFKLKQALIKLLPSHWYDGVWDDLSVKL